MRWEIVSGDAYAVGHQLGRLAREAFASVLPRIERYREVLEIWRGSERARALEQAARQHFPRYMRELDGIADGAGVPFADAFAWNCRGDFPGGGDQSALAGCTDVAACLGRGGAVIAHNEDDQPELDEAWCMVDLRPDEGQRIVSFYSPGLLPGHTFAFNAAGLVQTINHLRTHDQALGVPRHLLARAVLDCERIDDALALIRSTPRAGGFHHNLGSSASRPRLVSVEAPASGVAEREVSGCMVHANHLIRDELASVEQTVAPSSRTRQQRAEALTTNGVEDAAAALALLADTDDASWPIRRKGDSADDPGFTLASALFELDADQIVWRVFRDPGDVPVFRGSVRNSTRGPRGDS